LRYSLECGGLAPLWPAAAGAASITSFSNARL
jgi:hypothetical protein